MFSIHVCVVCLVFELWRDAVRFAFWFAVMLCVCVCCECVLIQMWLCLWVVMYCVLLCVCRCALMLGCSCVLVRALFTKVLVCVACDWLRDDVCVTVCVL